jgi:hypothetical protein
VRRHCGRSCHGEYRGQSGDEGGKKAGGIFHETDLRARPRAGGSKEIDAVDPNQTRVIKERDVDGSLAGLPAEFGGERTRLPGQPGGVGNADGLTPVRAADAAR